MLLDFEKPKKVENDYSFEDGPPGGYMPQMSDEDADKWKGKRVNKGKENDRIEIRKTLRGVQLLVIVANDGWDYKHEKRNPKEYSGYSSTKGLNVRMSMNGGLQMTFQDWDELNQVVNEAKFLIIGQIEHD